MSEYIDLQPEPTDDPDVMLVVTNQRLTPDGSREQYESPEAGEEGSALAQAIFEVPGIAALTLDAGEMLITRQPEVEWHDLIEEITFVIKDFFL